MNCAEIQAALPAYLGERGTSLALRRHISRCADCRAELETYEALHSGLTQLREVPAEVPPGLLASLMAIPQRASRAEFAKDHVMRNRLAYGGGVALALVGGTAALLWRRRRLGLA
ncbi:MAG: anti-sigma factor [Actinomycetota bacterium]